MDTTFAVLLEPNLLYLFLIVAAWVGILAVFVPGTGVIELVAALGLLFGVGGLVYRGADLLALLLLGASYALYALAVLGQLSPPPKLPDDGGPLWSRSPWLVALAATALQALGGLALVASLPGLAPLTVLALALASLAVYRWMLAPTVSALRPPPQSGAEALIGSWGEVRQAPPAPGRPAMVYVDGELWQAVSNDDLAVGDRVEVLDRQGMRLYVRKITPPPPNR